MTGKIKPNGEVEYPRETDPDGKLAQAVNHPDEIVENSLLAGAKRALERIKRGDKQTD